MQIIDGQRLRDSLSQKGPLNAYRTCYRGLGSEKWPAIIWEICSGCRQA